LTWTQNSLRRPSASGKHLGAVGVAHHLHIAFAVAQIDKNHAAVVTAAVDPAAQGNGFAHLGFGHQTAVMRTHGHCLLSRRCLVDSGFRKLVI
jgi:hypothetical protein